MEDQPQKSDQEPNSTSLNQQQPQIGRTYNVKRLDGQWVPADVLEKRELKGKPIEYFVHFENCKFENSKS